MLSCPYDPNIMSRFVPTTDGRAAEATLDSMFKFPEGGCSQHIKDMHIEHNLI